MQTLQGKRILVTGACGTVGGELVRLLLADTEHPPAEVVGLDHNESELFFLDQRHLDDDRASFFVANIRDRDELARRMAGMDVVFHTAALKHVVLCERSPYEAVQSNIEGVQNLVQAAYETGVEKVIFTSSDKAVNPTNVMGTSKLMGERLMTAAHANQRAGGPVFASTRFGNVLGSSGSVIPIFHRQIAEGGPVTVTHPEMTRFIMSLQEAVQLVIDSADLARGGEVFVTKMPVARIRDMARVMVGELAETYGQDPQQVEISEIGMKPGEKLYEELMSDEETRRSLELERYFAVLPAFRGLYQDIAYDYPTLVSEQVDNPYISAREEPLRDQALAAFLRDNGLLSPDHIPADHPARRYWPGDRS